MSESGNILDNAEVEFLLDAHESAPAPNKKKEDAEAQEQAVTMRGNLDQINLSDIFQTLAMSKMEGVLRVHNPLEQRHVYCCDGFVRILTPPRVIQRRIGQRLVQAGFITSDQLRSALMRQRKERHQLGQILVEDGVITQEQIEDVANVQVAEDLFSLFTWSHGTFEFYKGAVTDEALRNKFESCPEFEVSSLLLEVARRSDEWESILERISSLDELPITTCEESPRQLNEIEYAIFRGADGRQTYRQLAEQTTQGLFEVARVARDLVAEGLIAPISDEQMVATAEAWAEEGNPKQAVMVLQTLRDRPTDLTLDVVRGVAAVLERAGERKLAGLTLLEVAQLQSDPELALSMARDACAFAPHDPATLAFLRSTLLAHSPPDDPEIEQVTTTLIDAMLAEDQVEAALQVVDEARASGACGPAVLIREARLRQKGRDVAGAIAVFEEVAEIYRTLGDRDRLRETYEAILRIDRTRKDIQRLLHRMQQTRTARLVRAGAALVALSLLGSMGFVLWQQNRFETNVRAAGAEISELIQSGDRIAARERLVHWCNELGDCEEASDLRRQVDFADAAELQRRNQVERRRVNERLVNAAEMLDKGQLRSALVVYADLRENKDYRTEIDEVIATRLKAARTDIEEAAKIMTTRLPAAPTKLMDRRELSARLADIRGLCRPNLYVLVEDIASLYDTGEVPEFIAEEQRVELKNTLLQVRDVYSRAKRLGEAYASALELSDTQRKFDPLFKEALDRENAHDFAGALELFRRLQKAEVNDSELRTLFRDHVTRNATIVKLLEELSSATQAGNYEVAAQQLKALQLAFPDVPFDRLVRLPLRIESLPSGATVTVAGTTIGTTPCTVAYVPADPNRFALELPGFRPASATPEGAHGGVLALQLVLAPSHEFEHSSAVDTAPLAAAAGPTFLVDRGGNVSALTPGEKLPHWTFKTGDLSGLLTRPFRHGSQIVFGSLDGQLRALEGDSGRLAWSVPGLPTEIEPAQFDQFLALATTDDRLAVVDLDTHTVTEMPLGGAGRARVLAAGNRLIVATPTGIAAYAVPSLKRLWQQPMPNLLELRVAATESDVVAIDDRGNVACFQAKDGSENWRGVEDANVVGLPLIDGNAVIVLSQQRLVRMSLADGSRRRAVTNEEQRWISAPLQVGSRLLIGTATGEIDVLAADSGQLLYRLESSRRGARVLPWREGVVVALADRRIQLYPRLP
ncbi:MAG: PQQ-binding-like beta-propeller repeat protein [Planctomycetes bacterium]|nr:PQQ-binding-like beta-propeller repeat protein [Planctomycetota bacterium]